MARRLRLGLLALSVVVVLVSPFSPAKLSSADAGGSLSGAGESLFVQVRGTADRQPGSAPERFVYEPDVYDMNNQKIGTVTHDVMFSSPTTLDLVSTFHLPDGDIVNHGVEAIGPDSSRQGFFLIGVHSDQDTIQAAENTGMYSGRTGRLRMSGWHDGSQFPQAVTFNGFYEISLHPKSEPRP